MLCSRCYAFTACVLFVLLNENLLIIWSNHSLVLSSHVQTPMKVRTKGGKEGESGGKRESGRRRQTDSEAVFEQTLSETLCSDCWAAEAFIQNSRSRQWQRGGQWFLCFSTNCIFVLINLERDAELLSNVLLTPFLMVQ